MSMWGHLLQQYFYYNNIHDTTAARFEVIYAFAILNYISVTMTDIFNLLCDDIIDSVSVTWIVWNTESSLISKLIWVDCEDLVPTTSLN